MINQTRVDESKSKELASKLNLLLSDLQLFYMNAKGFHWNVKGKKLFELQGKFEELYKDALIKIDEVAERILALGNQPIHSFSDYLKNVLDDE